MSFAPEYVHTVLNENFEDAKALFLEPLLAIHGAHLVMLAEQDIVRGRRARRIRDALAAVCRDTVRRTPYDGSCEDLFFFVERLIAERAGDVAGRLHTARSRNDIDMTMYRMRQRGFVLDLLDADAGAARARWSASPRRTSRRCSRRTRTRSGPSRPRWRTTCSASSSSSSATAGGCAPPSPPPTGRRWAPAPSPARPSRSIATRTSALLGFDGADRQHLRQHRHGRLPAREPVGGVGDAGRRRPRRPGSAALVHGGVPLPASRRRVRAGEQHHAAEAQPGRARARALDRQQGARPGDGGDAERAQHAVRRHRRHRGRPAAARAPDVPRRGARGVAGRRVAADRDLRRRRDGPPRRARGSSPSPSWPTR